jgi:hypothetical protein
MNAADMAIKATPKSKRGRRKETARKALMINHLRPLFKDLTNKDPFKTTSKKAISQFYGFIEKFLIIIGKPAQSRNVLKTELQPLKKISPKKKRT